MEYETEWEGLNELILSEKIEKFLSYKDSKDILRVKQVASLRAG